MHVGVSKMSYKIGSTKGYSTSSSLTKKETMTIDDDTFSLVASINTTSFDLRALIEFKKVGKLSPRKVWVPKYCLVCVDRLKKEWAAVCTYPLLGRNSVKGTGNKAT